MLELKITSENIEGLKEELKGLINVLQQGEESVAPAKAVEKKKKEKVAATKVKEIEVDEDEENEEEAESEITLEEIRAKAKELAEEKGKATVKKLLTKFKVAKVTELPESKYASFHETLEDLLDD